MSIECPELRLISAKRDAQDSFPFVVRIRGLLQKRSGAFPYRWHGRHAIVAGNFLFEFVSASDPAPRKVVLLDGCTITHVEDKTQPFAFMVKTTAMRQLYLAAPSAEDRDAWIRQMSNAGYDKTAARAISAHHFIVKCAEVLWEDNVDEDDEETLAAAAGEAGTGGAESKSDDEADKGAAAGAAASASSGQGSGGAPKVDRPPATAQGVLDLVYQMQDERRELKAALADAEQRLRRMPEDGAALDATVTASQDSFVRSLRQRIGELEDQAAADGAERAAARAENASLKEERRALLARAEAAEARADAASGDGGGDGGDGETKVMLQESRAEVSSLRRTMVDLETARTEAEEERAAVARELALCRTALRAAQDREMDLSASKAALDHQLKQARSASPGAKAAGAGRAAAPRVDSFRSADVAARMEAAAPAPGAASPPAAATSAAADPAADPATQSTAAEDARRHEWVPFQRDAQAHERAGNLAEAQDLFQRVYQVRKRISGDSSVAVATAARNLGRVLALQRRFPEACALYTEAVNVSSDVLGTKHANTACALTDLAAVLREQGKFGLAEERARQAVEALKESVGEHDVSTATAMYNLAGLQKRSHKHDEAKATYTDALAVFRSQLGEGKGETADTLYQLGSLFRRGRSYAEAMDHFNQAAGAYSQAYGRDDRRVAEATKRASAMAEAMTRSR